MYVCVRISLKNPAPGLEMLPTLLIISVFSVRHIMQGPEISTQSLVLCNFPHAKDVIYN